MNWSNPVQHRLCPLFFPCFLSLLLWSPLAILVAVFTSALSSIRRAGRLGCGYSGLPRCRFGPGNLEQNRGIRNDESIIFFIRWEGFERGAGQGGFSLAAEWLANQTTLFCIVCMLHRYNTCMLVTLQYHHNSGVIIRDHTECALAAGVIDNAFFDGTRERIHPAMVETKHPLNGCREGSIKRRKKRIELHRDASRAS